MTIRFDDKTTIGDKYGPAMKIADQADADAYFAACVEHTMRFGKTREEAEEIERHNLGYYTGYCDRETAARVFRLFRCAHPVFGTRTDVTAEEAYQAGLDMARKV